MGTRIKNSQGGQGTLEFALIVPVLLLIVFTVFEAGRAILIYQAVSTASREAARLGSSVHNHVNCNAIRNKALQHAALAKSQASDVSIYYVRTSLTPPGLGNCGSVTAAQILTGDRIVVTVTGYFNPAAAIPIIKIPQLTFTATTRRTIVKSLEIGRELAPGTNLAELFGTVWP